MATDDGHKSDSESKSNDMGSTTIQISSELLDKGTALYDAMTSSMLVGIFLFGVHLLQSPFLTITDLFICGWKRGGLSYSMGGLSHIFDALQISKPNFEAVSWYHVFSGHSYTNGPIICAPTYGFFHSLFDVSSGTIVAYDNESPTSIIGKDSDPLPQIHNWSDVVFLEWNLQTESRPHLLNYVWHVNICNEVSATTIFAAIQYARHEKFPDTGIYLPMASDGAKAILGTPNGKGVAYLLMSHRRQMNDKVVTGIWVFGKDVDRDEDTALEGALQELNVIFVVGQKVLN